MESAAFGFQFGQGETTIIITSFVETAVFSHYICFFKIFQGSTQILKKYAEIRRNTLSKTPSKTPQANTLPVLGLRRLLFLKLTLMVQSFIGSRGRRFAQRSQKPLGSIRVRCCPCVKSVTCFDWMSTTWVSASRFEPNVTIYV